MQLAWEAIETKREAFGGPAVGFRPWATWMATGLLIAVMLFVVLAGPAVWEQVALTAGLRASIWAWDDPTSYLRLVSYQVIHGSPMHFLGNTIILLLAGPIVERRNRSAATIAILTVGGIVAALAHLAFFPDETRPLIGASGAVAALFGMAFMTASDLALPVRFPRRSRVFIRLTLRRALGLWAGVQLAATVNTVVVVGDAAPVAYWSHLAGFATGIAGIWLLRLLAARQRLPEPVRFETLPSAGD